MSSNYNNLRDRLAADGNIAMTPMGAQPSAPYAQPVYGQEGDVPYATQVPMAQPALPMAQPYVAQAAYGIPAASPIPAARPVPAAVPAALPVEAGANGVYVPPPPSPEELDQIINTREVVFTTNQYLRDARVFFKRNTCSLVGVTTMWIFICVVLTMGSLHMLMHRVVHDAMENLQGDDLGMDPYMPEGGDISSSSDSNYDAGFPPPPRLHDVAEMDSTDSMDSWDMQNEHYNQRMREFCALMQEPAVFKHFVAWIVLQVVFFFTIYFPAFLSFFLAICNAMRANSPIRFRDYFAGFRCRTNCSLIPVMLAVRVIGGVLSLLWIPGIWWTVAAIFAIPLKLEHRFLGTCVAMKHSVKVVNRVWCSMFGFILGLCILNGFGFLCFGFGMLLTLPYSGVAFVYCYHHLIGIKEMPMIARPAEAAVVIHA